jgi:hypothetical protein
MSVYFENSAGDVEQVICSECGEYMPINRKNAAMMRALPMFSEAHLGCRRFGRVARRHIGLGPSVPDQRGD